MNSKMANKNVIMACQITGVYDVNRNETLATDDYKSIEAWCKSIIALNLTGIIFHNNFSATFCAQHTNNNITFIKVAYNANYNPNVFRYLVYQNYLKTNTTIANLFITDVSDVVVVQNPFETDFFKNNTGKIFCGDEPKKLDNEWMQAHSTHLRNNIEDYAAYEKQYENAILLNCGIIGGNINIMRPFINKLAAVHKKYNSNNTTKYTGDMGAFNYIIRTNYNTNLLHGAPINTIFKANEVDRMDCWFRHK
jgi:hypothetical protein